ncbi:unnamed protein product [marine sediment metagenome]|uniref:Uncharacterized protein n=1 Tax=marine sediment metagenome TaxID=412755 RepID=X1KDV5_9ZZZZ
MLKIRVLVDDTDRRDLVPIVTAALALVAAATAPADPDAPPTGSIDAFKPK